MTIFHLAIPSHDLALSKQFYTEVCGATLGREYPHYVVFHFFGHQLVCHLAPEEVPKELKMYPRHFGPIFEKKEDFDALYARAKKYQTPFFEESFERFAHKPGWHYSFFLIDPSNNLIEVKHYVNSSDIFS
ncbi:MAG: hypothetical protein RLZ35_1261 [Pseudomonadota bacterium]|jgi:hypothetical protein